MAYMAHLNSPRVRRKAEVPNSWNSRPLTPTAAVLTVLPLYHQITLFLNSVPGLKTHFERHHVMNSSSFGFSM